ncbi:MAG TPA: cytochrome b5 domain-containing protein [Acidobacteriota bacterium]|nr:cytochrome b5 domain-containing protein [Acidobacteriota bacterium]
MNILGKILLFVAITIVVSIAGIVSYTVNTGEVVNQTQTKTIPLTQLSVSEHNTKGDCWTIIDGNVYDITSYISAHPGGPIILQACGIDATSLFQTKGDSGKPHSTFAKELLLTFQVGSVNASTQNVTQVAPPVVQNETVVEIVEEPVNETVEEQLTSDEVANHDSIDSCWIIVNNNVYDVTSYISIHPGGKQAILANCGKDATTAFGTKNGEGAHSSFAQNLLKSFLVGPLVSTPTSPPIATITKPLPSTIFDAGTTSVNLAVTTDKDAVCHWSKSDKTFSTMTAFTTTGTTSHKTTVTNIADGQSYKLYVRCQDTDGNVMTSSASVSFTVSNPIPADIQFTLEEVALHASRTDCWIIVNDNVYDVTSYIPAHPGGTTRITRVCGTDATVDFETQGGEGSHSSFAQNLLETFLVGALDQTIDTPPSASITQPATQLAAGTTSTTFAVTTNEAATCRWSTSNEAYSSMPNTFSTTGATTHTTTLTGLSDGQSYTRYVRCIDNANNVMTSSVSITFSVANQVNPGTSYDLSQVSQHNSQSSCWIIVGTKVYDVTTYISVHPGGASRILNVCGTDATTAFNTRGGTGSHSNTAKNLLQSFAVGDYAPDVNQPPPPEPTSIEEVIQAAYPGATIKEINTEDDGTSEVQIKYQGQDVTVRLDANNNII